MAEALLDVAELAQLFGVTEKTIRDWQSQGMPVAKAGGKGRGNKAKYALRDVVEWYFDENYERLELDRQRTRLASEQAQKLAIENAIRLGAVGEFDVWCKELQKFLAEVKAALLSLPTREAPRLNGDVNQRKDRLELAVHEILRRLAAYRPSRPGSTREAESDGGDSDPGAATKADRKPVGRSRKVPKPRK